MTDYKQLCVELVHELHGYKVAHPNHDTDLIDRARDILAKPEPDPEEVKKWLMTNCVFSGMPPAPYRAWNEWAEAVVSAKVIQGVHIKAFNPPRPAAAPTEPEPEGPTDEQLDELFIEIDQTGEPKSWRTYVRAALARWGK